MKIYTKRGDQGETSLMGGGSVSKDVPRVEAYGTVDELNTVIGWASTQIKGEDLRQALSRVQEHLFVLGSEMATPQPSVDQIKGYIQGRQIEILEKEMDTWEKGLPPLKQFILPGGGEGGAALHLARAVCRRAERCLVSLQQKEALRPEALQYLNRLSDWLFVLARLANHQEGISEVPWQGLQK